MESYIQEDYSKSFIQHYTTLIEWNSNYPRYYHIRGCACYKQGNFKEAIDNFTRAIELDNEQWLYYQNRAIVYYKLGQYKQATSDFTRVISLKDIDKENSVSYESAQLLLKRADTLRLQGNLEAAIEDYEKAQDIMRNLPEEDKNVQETDFDVVREYTLRSEYIQGLIDDYTTLISLSSDELDYYYIRGDLYYEQKAYKKAIQDYTVIINSGANDAKLFYAYYKRGLCNYKYTYEDIEGDFKKALVLLDKVSPNDTLKGSLYLKTGAYEKALSALTQALSKNPEDACAYRYRGKTYYELGKNEEAIQDLSKAITYDGKYAEDYYDRGKCYSELGMLEQAIEDYTSAIALEGDRYEYYQYRSRAYSDMEKHEESIEDLTTIIDNKLFCLKYYDDESMGDLNILFERENKEYLAMCYCKRAINYYELDMKKQAMEDYSKAIGLYPDYSTPYYGRGILYKEQKNYEKALENYSMALKLEESQETIVKILKSRAFVYEQVRQYENALQDYTRLIESTSDNKTYYISRASIYRKLKAYDKAIDDYTYVISMDTFCTEAFLGRADAYREKGNLDAAIRDYEAANHLLSRNNKE